MVLSGQPAVSNSCLQGALLWALADSRRWVMTVCRVLLAFSNVQTPDAAKVSAVHRILVHSWDSNKILKLYSLLSLSTLKNVKCYPTMIKNMVVVQNSCAIPKAAGFPCPSPCGWPCRQNTPTRKLDTHTMQRRSL